MTLKINSSNELLENLAVHVEKVTKQNKKSTEQQLISGNGNIFRLGEVAPNYKSGRPSIIFSGELEPSGKKYPYLSSYSPAAGDKVLLIRTGNSFVVMGKII